MDLSKTKRNRKPSVFLTEKQKQVLRVYHQKPKYLTDNYVAEVTGLPRNSICQLRQRMTKLGYSFAFITSDKGGGIHHKYKYIGKVGLGEQCVDPEMHPCDKALIKQYEFRVRAKNTKILMDWLIDNNHKGYWTQNQIALKTGMTTHQIHIALQSLKINLGFEVHGRFEYSRREYIVTGITGMATRYESKDTKQSESHTNLINKVFG